MQVQVWQSSHDLGQKNNRISIKWGSDLYGKVESGMAIMGLLTQGAQSYTLDIEGKIYEVYWLEKGTLSVNYPGSNTFEADITRLGDFFLPNNQASLLTQLEKNINAAAKQFNAQCIYPDSFLKKWNGYYQNEIEKDQYKQYKTALLPLLKGKLPTQYAPFAAFIHDCLTKANHSFAYDNINLTALLNKWKGLHHLTLTTTHCLNLDKEIEAPWHTLQSKQSKPLRSLTIAVSDPREQTVFLNNLLSFLSQQPIPSSFTLTSENILRIHYVNYDALLDILSKKKLSSLHLHHTHLSMTEHGKPICTLLARFLRDNPQLKSLSLTRLPLHSSSECLIQALIQHPHLEELILEHNSLDQVAIDALFAAALMMPNLKTLHFVQTSAPSSLVLKACQNGEGKKIAPLQTLRMRCPISWFKESEVDFHRLKKLELLCDIKNNAGDIGEKEASFWVQLTNLLDTYKLLTFLKVSVGKYKLGHTHLRAWSEERELFMQCVETHPNMHSFVFPIDVFRGKQDKNSFDTQLMTLLNHHRKLVFFESGKEESTVPQNRLRKNQLLADLTSHEHQETHELFITLCTCLPDVPTEVIVLLVASLIHLEEETGFPTIEQYHD